ncbi:MAG: hypothetical protein MK132_17960 [Lentisphaerales bacterium]|nr:hypothetical protein [Lentisphaerales bacterium]
MLSKFPVGLFFLFSFMMILQGARLPEEVNKYSFLINDIRNKCLKRDYQQSLKLFEVWFKGIADKSLNNYIKSQQSLVEEAQQIFKNLQNVSEEKISGTAFPIDKKKALASSIKAGTLIYKLSLGSGFKTETIPINELPALSLYYLLKNVAPESYLLDTAKILILDQQYQSAKNLIAKAKKANQDIAPLAPLYKNWQATEEILSFHKQLLEICENINNYTLSSVPAKLKPILLRTEENDFLKALYSNCLATLYSHYNTAFENRRKKELELFTNFPAQKGEIASIECLNYPGQKYQIYLPQQYDFEGHTKLPIVFTFHPGGKSLINKFKKVADELGLIIIAHPPTRGRLNWYHIKLGWYALMRDIPRRIHFDPSRQFASGNNGGGYYVYPFARTFSHKISGIIPMGGWLANQKDPILNWYRKGLLVGRTTGDDDNGKHYLWTDKEHLDKFNVVIKDWFHERRTPSPPEILTKVFTWLFEQRTPSVAEDVLKGSQFKDEIEQKVSIGKITDAINSCLYTILYKPYTYEAIEASKAFEVIIENHSEEILKSYSATESLKESILVADFIGNYMFMAALHGEDKAFNCCLHMLKKYSKTNHWRYQVAWFMATSKYPKIRNNQEAAVVLSTVKLADNTDTKILKAAVYLGIGKDYEAEELYNSIMQDVTAEKDYHSAMYKTLKRLMNK